MALSLRISLSGSARLISSAGAGLSARRSLLPGERAGSPFSHGDERGVGIDQGFARLVGQGLFHALKIASAAGRFMCLPAAHLPHEAASC